MRCIWSTTTLMPWGVCSLRLIVQNMRTWALEDFRSRTVHKLEVLRHRYRRRPSGSSLAGQVPDTAPQNEESHRTVQDQVTSSTQVAQRQEDSDPLINSNQHSDQNSTGGAGLQSDSVLTNQQTKPAVLNQASTSTAATQILGPATKMSEMWDSNHASRTVSEGLIAAPEPFIFGNNAASTFDFEPCLWKKVLNDISKNKIQPRHHDTGIERFTSKAPEQKVKNFLLPYSKLSHAVAAPTTESITRCMQRSKRASVESQVNLQTLLLASASKPGYERGILWS